MSRTTSQIHMHRNEIERHEKECYSETLFWILECYLFAYLIKITRKCFMLSMHVVSFACVAKKWIHFWIKSNKFVWRLCFHPRVEIQQLSVLGAAAAVASADVFLHPKQWWFCSHQWHCCEHYSTRVNKLRHLSNSLPHRKCLHFARYTLYTEDDKIKEMHCFSISKMFKLEKEYIVVAI